MTCGFFTIKSSKPTTFNYTCSEFIIVLEGAFTYLAEQPILKNCPSSWEFAGEICFEDKATLLQTIVKAGDVVRIDEGTTVKCSSPSSGQGFPVAQHDEE
ncbi:hypothetical protein BYT27DRAFT_7260542 [Phlegmacium glaucopus]|nr:hypothetical protein BYT27DRAFT_7260542 [Phlegmacium glaucopus]